VVQVATRTGVLGNGTPFVSLGLQVCSSSLHHSLPAQSASTLQPTLHTPLA